MHVTLAGDRRPWLHVLAAGIIISFIMCALVMPRREMSWDLKVFYTGGRLVLSGGNPYDSQQLMATSQRLAPEGNVVGTVGFEQLQPPGVIAMFAAVSWLPWSAARLLFLIVASFSLATVISLSLARFGAKQTGVLYWFLCAASLAFPPVWQNFILGQLSIISIGFALLAAMTVDQNRPIGTALFALLAMLKFTCTLPLIAILFIRANRTQRIAIAVGMVLFAALNAVPLIASNATEVLRAYRHSVTSNMQAGGINDPEKNQRLDLSSITPLCGEIAVAAMKVAVLLPLISIITRSEQRRPLTLTQLSLILVISLLPVYHRVYDLAILLPLFVAVLIHIPNAIRRRAIQTLLPWAAAAVLYGLVIASAGANHNILSVFDIKEPTAFKPCLLIALIPLLWWMQVRSPTASLPEKADSLNAPPPAPPVSVRA
jgi:Glycosyltransferase family 87